MKMMHKIPHRIGGLDPISKTIGILYPYSYSVGGNSCSFTNRRMKDGGIPTSWSYSLTGRKFCFSNYVDFDSALSHSRLQK